MLKAFESGADGVLVEGCLKEQCHYVDGNYKAEERVHFLRELLNRLGIGKERLQIHFMSAAMANEFARVSTEFTEQVRALGPSPLKKLKKPTPYSSRKREMLKSMLVSISQELKMSKAVLKKAAAFDPYGGFGNPILDEKKCIGCGACSFVCKDDAMKIDHKKDHALLKHEYWRCTSCGTCEAVCPEECLKVNSGFNLHDFLYEKPKVKMKIEMKECERCGTRFLPLLVGKEIEKILINESRAFDSIGMCPKCKLYNRAERIGEIQKAGRLGKLKA
jgi:formate hydrogenlyase subunit 6/NADH:ubiquinone oxidoreductase subunit I